MTGATSQYHIGYIMIAFSWKMYKLHHTERQNAHNISEAS